MQAISTPLRRNLLFTFCTAVLLFLLEHRPALLTAETATGQNALWYAAEFLLILLACAVNLSAFRAALQEFSAKRPGTETLFSLSILFSILFSAGTVIVGEPLSTGLLFPASVLLFLHPLSQVLLQFLLSKNADLHDSLVQHLPESASVLRQRKEVAVAPEELCPNDLFTVRPGERIPADCVVLDGTSTVRETIFTGKEDPSPKSKGSVLYAGSENLDGGLICRATFTGDRTVLARMIRQADASSAPALPPRVFVLTLAAAALCVLWLLGQPAAFAAHQALAVLTVGAFAPFAFAASAAAQRSSLAFTEHGILCAVSRYTALANLKKLYLKQDVVSTPHPEVFAVVGTRAVPEKFLVSMAASLMSDADNTPNGHAILDYAVQQGIKARPAANIQQQDTCLTGFVAGKEIACGTLAWAESECGLTADLKMTGAAMSAQGAEVVYFALDRHPAGIIAIAPVLRPGLEAAVNTLRENELSVHLLDPDYNTMALATPLSLTPETPASPFPADAAVAATQRPSCTNFWICPDGSSSNAPVSLLNGLSVLPQAITLCRTALQRRKQAIQLATVLFLLFLLLATGFTAPLIGFAIPAPVLAVLLLAAGVFCFRRTFRSEE